MNERYSHKLLNDNLHKKYDSYNTQTPQNNLIYKKIIMDIEKQIEYLKDRIDLIKTKYLKN